MPETEPQNRPLGYARVSTYGQTLDAQLEQLRKAGCAKVCREKVTGAQADRRELLKMLKALAPGDVVTVRRINRLARSTFDLFAIVKQIVDAKAQSRSLAEPWADTATSTVRRADRVSCQGRPQVARHSGLQRPCPRLRNPLVHCRQLASERRIAGLASCWFSIGPVVELAGAITLQL